MRIAVDFDGTLAKYDGLENLDYNPAKVGPPILRMIERVRRWIAEGHDVVIFTARVHPSNGAEEVGICTSAIIDFCQENFGRRLEITCVKDPKMSQIWDDKAISVERDTGRIDVERLAIMEANEREV